MEPARIAQETTARIRHHLRRAIARPTLLAAVCPILAQGKGGGPQVQDSGVVRSSGSDLYAWSAWFLLHTLRIGGVAMAVVSIGLLAARRRALLADAAVSGVVGAVLILTGVGMVADDGDLLQTIVNVGCGALFLSAAKHHGREYLSIRAATQETPVANVTDPRSLQGPPAPVAVAPPAPSYIDNTHDEETAPPEGFLAALAEKNPPEEIEHSHKRKV